MGWLSGARQVSYARRDLDTLAERLASAGLSTSALDAGSLAYVDQHAAAVRDSLALGGARCGVVELAAYAQGVLDAAAEAGWTPENHRTLISTQPDPEPISGTAEWIASRLLAVCVLADASSVDDISDIDPLLFA
ncbi:DUF6401 family natural product biosynthesis protein [Saccharomonospora sp.]|uniref:DUF6401 family natural product biosynthesis protein n=1 Tax=Saccharomonospora sp. TaxID=33913 RepID=UPI00260BB03B|nr:DUF6401 family natural product biosynthesis protein [Saccharomonospora sp.]